MPHRHRHLPHWHYHWRLPGLTGLYLNASLRNFAVSMISIFIPIYIYKTTNSIQSIFVYYLYYYAFMLIMNYSMNVLMTKIGPDISVLISNIVLGGYLLSISLLKHNFNFVYLAALCDAILTPLYWIPYHLAFVKLGKEEQYGENVSLFSIVGRISAALGPLIGGLIIVAFGFESLFLVTVTIVLLSTIPLFFDRFKRVSKAPPFNHILRELVNPKYRDDLWAFWGVALEGIVLAIFWPIFVYKIVVSYKIIGAISSLGLLLSMGALFWAGKKVNKEGTKIYRMGLVGNSFNWLIRILLNSGWQIFIADFFYNLGSALLWTPFETMVYRKAAETEPFEFLIKREYALHTGGLMATLLVWLVWSFIPNWFVIFCLGALGICLTSLMIKKQVGRI